MLCMTCCLDLHWIWGLIYSSNLVVFPYLGTVICVSFIPETLIWLRVSMCTFVWCQIIPRDFWNFRKDGFFVYYAIPDFMRANWVAKNYWFIRFLMLCVQVTVNNAFKTVEFHRSLRKSAGQGNYFIILLIKQMFFVLCICLDFFFYHLRCNEARQWICLRNIKLFNWATWY